MLVTIYRKYIPAKVREVIYRLFLCNFLIHYRKLKDSLKCTFYLFRYSIIKPKNEKEESLYNFGKAGISPYPYSWINEYKNQHFEVIINPNNQLPYILHNHRKLYFKHDMVTNAENAYKALLIEQDQRSAHRYVSDYKELKGKTLLDIGAAEGIFTLDVIEYIDHAFLFECDENWIKALEATFAPWKEKITIIRKYVSDNNDEQNITIDEFLKNKPIKHLFLKMDIEGFERKALQGCQTILQHRDEITGSICIYHRKDDPEIIQSLLTNYGYTCNRQPGVLYFEKEFRPAIIRFKA